MIKLLTVVGARPQFIKASVLSRAFAAYPDIVEVMVHTGQHFDENMSELFFRELNLRKPDYHLGVHELSAVAMTAKMMIGLDEILKKEQPDAVIVVGDTNSTLAGALAARQNGIRLAHIEAGMRNYSLEMPEELNRVLTDRISDWLFCPTARAVENLIEEGYQNFPVFIQNVGDVMYDAAIHFKPVAEKESHILHRISSPDFLLCSFHRAGNVDDPVRLASIVNALNKLSESRPVVLPLHPRTRKRMQEANLHFRFDTFEPLGYLDMIQLLNRCSLVITDSGGLQKEAYFYKKNCVVLREDTEWVELVENGNNALSGTETSSILHQVERMLSAQTDFSNYYFGKGNAGTLIADSLYTDLSKT